jgi:hypothetical protein
LAASILRTREVGGWRAFAKMAAILLRSRRTRGMSIPYHPPPSRPRGDAPCGGGLIELVAMARGASHNTDVTLTDGMDASGDAPADDIGTILWKYVAFHIIRSPPKGSGMNSSQRSRCLALKAKIGSPGCRSIFCWIGVFEH